MAKRDWTDPESGRTPTAIGSIEINLYDHDGTPSNKGASATARILDQDGNVLKVRRVEDIKPLLTAAQITGLGALMTRLRTKAEQKLLPTP